MKLNAKTRLTAAAKPVMYHVTHKDNLPSIQIKGLVPAKRPTGFSVNKAQWVKNAIYFTSSLKGARDWMVMLSSDRGLNAQEAAKFVILKVDLGEWHTKLREDPDWERELGDKTDAYYLVGVTIPPENLTLVKSAGAVRKINKESDARALKRQIDSYVYGDLPKLIKRMASVPAEFAPLVKKELEDALARVQREIGDRGGIDKYTKPLLIRYTKLLNALPRKYK